MRRNIGLWRAAANAGFALAVLALAGFGLYQVAGRHWRVQPMFRVRAEFATIGGLEAGHRVRLQGIDAGVVERVVAPSEPGRPVELVLRIDERLRPLVRDDAVARIVSEGLVGAKVVELTPGRPDAPPVARWDGSPPSGRSRLPTSSGGPPVRWNGWMTLTRSAEQGLAEVNSIAGSIRRGEGSLGKLVQDETIYRELVALSRRGERTLAALEENLDALKQTWPISRYFDRRAYLDRERVLFQPGSQRNSRSLRADELFEPGRSVLTPMAGPGSTRWPDGANRPVGPARRSLSPRSPTTTATRTSPRSSPRSRPTPCATTSSTKHSIQSAGWFKRRKVASVGFGTHIPPTLDPGPANQPSRRVDVILFTPQA